MHSDYSDGTQSLKGMNLFSASLLIAEHLLLVNTIVIQIKVVHAVLVYVWWVFFLTSALIICNSENVVSQQNSQDSWPKNKNKVYEYAETFLKNKAKDI